MSGLHLHPPDGQPAEPDRGDSRCRLDAGPLLDGRRRRCRRDRLHPRTGPGAAPVRLIVRRVKPTPGSGNWPSSPDTAITASSPTGTERPSWADHRPRRDRERHSRPQVRRRSAVRPFNALGWPGPGQQPHAVRTCPHRKLAGRSPEWTARIGLGEQIATTKTLRRRFFSLVGRLTRSARRPACICHSAGLGKPSSVAPWHGCERFHSQPDGARGRN